MKLACLNVLRIYRGHVDLEGYARSWWPLSPLNPVTCVKLVSWGQRPLNDTKHWWRINYTLIGRRFVEFFMILKEEDMYKVCNRVWHMSSVKCSLVNYGVLEVSHTSYSPDLEPANALLLSKVESALKEIWFQDAVGHQVIFNFQIKCISFGCH